MQIRTQAGKWTGRIITIFVLGVGGFFFGAILLEEAFNVDVEAMIEPIVSAIDLTGTQVVYLFIGVVFVAIGAVTVLTRGGPALLRAVTLARHDPVPVGTLHLESGTVEGEGTAEPMDGHGTTTAPYSGRDCLGFRYETKGCQRQANDETEWGPSSRASTPCRSP